MPLDVNPTLTGSPLENGGEAGDTAHLLAALGRRTHVRTPYDYWLFTDMLPAGVASAIAGLPFAPPPPAGFDGRRETHNSSRHYFTPATRAVSPVIGRTIDLFSDDAVVAALSDLTGVALSEGRLRIEYCQDVDGFWLEPHVDISAKLMTLLVYVSDDPRLADAGTDVYDASPEHRPVARAPYRRNDGLLFVPAADTWHGFTKRPIRGLRKSIIVNFVTADWRSTQELALA